MLGVDFSLHSLVVANWPVLTVGCVMKLRKSWCKTVDQSNLITPQYGFWTFVFSFQPPLDFASPCWCHPIPQTRFRKVGKEQSWLCLHPAPSLLRRVGKQDPLAPQPCQACCQGSPALFPSAAAWRMVDRARVLRPAKPAPSLGFLLKKGWYDLTKFCFCPPLPYLSAKMQLCSTLCDFPQTLGLWAGVKSFC